MRWLFILFSFYYNFIIAQISYRGICAPNSNSVWISGSKGTVKILDSLGHLIKDASPKGFETKDFRAVFAWDSKNAILLSVADSTVILRTNDGGNTWLIAYENNEPGIFFDDLDFKNNIGFAVADPMFNTTTMHYYYPIIKSNDSGKTWHAIEWISATNTTKDAGLFSASGSNIISTGRKTAFCAGGQVSKFYTKNKSKALPIKSGGTYGPYCMDNYKKIWLIGGGNYALKTAMDSNACISFNHGKTWEKFYTIPIGYVSSIKFVNNKKWLIACGSAGVCISNNQGKTWKTITTQGFNCIAVHKNRIWIVGNTGNYYCLHTNIFKDL